MAEQKAMERDPVCGMQVDPAAARAKSEYRGRTYYFCCAGCAKKFEASPEEYLKPRATTPHSAGPVLMTISPAASGAKPVSMQPSAMAASKTTASRKSAVSAADYTCPMDPETHQTYHSRPED